MNEEKAMYLVIDWVDHTVHKKKRPQMETYVRNEYESGDFTIIKCADPVTIKIEKEVIFKFEEGSNQ